MDVVVTITAEDLGLTGRVPARGYMDVSLYLPAYGDPTATTKALRLTLIAGEATVKVQSGDVVRFHPVQLDGVDTFLFLIPAQAEVTYGELVASHRVEPDGVTQLPPGSTAAQFLAATEAARDDALESADVASGFADDARDEALLAEGYAQDAADSLASLNGQKGAVNGIGSLDGAGKQPESQVPVRLSEASLNATIATQISTPDAAARVAADGIFARQRGLRLFSDLIPLGARNSKNALSSGAQTNPIMTKMYVAAPAPLAMVEAVYTNMGVDDAVGAANITVRASVEYPSGTFTLGRDADGNLDFVVPPGGRKRIYFPVAHPGPSAAGFWVRTYAASASNIPQNFIVRTQSPYFEGSEYSATDKTASGTITTNDNTYAFGPTLVLGHSDPGANLPVVCGLGDSIMSGQGDRPLDRGWFVQAFGGHLPFVKYGRPGATSQTFWAIQTWRLYVRGATHTVVLLGTNDAAAGGATFDIVSARLLAIYLELIDWGTKPWGVTLPPRTTSTDSYVTTANQTAFNTFYALGGSSDRARLNDWIRAGAPMDAATRLPVAPGTSGAVTVLDGSIDLADACETARNSGYWKTNAAGNWATSDGLHPNTVIHTAAGASVDTSLFVVA